MKRKKLADIRTSEDRNELLQYLLNKELEKIRKKIYKYQRRDTIWNPITIQEFDFVNDSTGGLYEWDKDEEEHRIKIAINIVKNYVTPCYNWWYPKSRDKEVLINTIGHEIVHALVKEKFEFIFKKIKYKNRDASPVFLATLQFLGYRSNHDCASNYIGTKVWKDIYELKKRNGTWDEFINYIFFYLESIEDIKNTFNKEHELLGQTIEFNFSSENSGLKKLAEYNTNIVAYLKNTKEIKSYDLKYTTFEIGSMMDIDSIKELFQKKLNNGIKADIFINQKQKVIGDSETKQNKFLYDRQEVFNIYKGIDTVANDKIHVNKNSL